jgi:hypothetical protein
MFEEVVMKGVRAKRAYKMHLAAAPTGVFPLLCPTREYDWIDTWRCRMVYSESGHAEPDCIFKTDFPADGPEDTWVVSRYEPPLLIEFVRVNALRAIRYMISLRETEGGQTEAVWRQVITGLNEEGNSFVQGLDKAAFQKRMAEIELMLNHYLDTGQMRRHG